LYFLQAIRVTVFRQVGCVIGGANQLTLE